METLWSMSDMVKIEPFGLRCIFKFPLWIPHCVWELLRHEKALVLSFFALWWFVFVFSVDIKDAYLHISIFAVHQCYPALCSGEGQDFQFVALPFGLAMAQQVFVKSVGSSAPFWSICRISNQGMASGLRCKKRMQDIDWTLNITMLPLEPSECLQYLGLALDTALV